MNEIYYCVGAFVTWVLIVLLSLLALYLFYSFVLWVWDLIKLRTWIFQAYETFMVYKKYIKKKDFNKITWELFEARRTELLTPGTRLYKHIFHKKLMAYFIIIEKSEEYKAYKNNG